MIDANSQFFAILTQVGEAKQANADALGRPWLITEMGVGDANGTDPVPDRLQTRLINEWRRRPLNLLKVDPVNPAVIIAEQVIPADEGGKWIRELGLYDADGDLVAVANCAPSFKPVLSQGSGRTQIVRMNLIVSSTGNINLKIDPAVVLATREFVEQRLMEELYKLDNKQSVRVATTANVALAGIQTLDGIALSVGDRVLVKNQAAAKDNGIYVVATGSWQRAPDADSNAEVTSALLVSVEQGATLADTRWQLITDGTIMLGTTALTFQNVTQGFAPLVSPALVNPTANTPPQFEAGTPLATAEFVQRALGNYQRVSSLSAAATLTVSAFGSVISLNGTFTVTLPLASAAPSGGAIHFRNIGNGVVTVVCMGPDTINAGAEQARLLSFPVLPGATLELLTAGGTAWWASGSAQLQYSGMFANSLAPNGYQKLPGGFILQWGQVTCAAGQGGQGSIGATVTLPLAYPNNHRQTVLTPAQTSTTQVSAWIDFESSVSFRVSTNGIAGTVVRFISIGM
ncbi:phage tail protein [Pseudomonas putida]|uniref:phage tail protein n=1 Tax=Pseudomonas putida TaxID=303 RepID=UPI003FD3D231